MYMPIGLRIKIQWNARSISKLENNKYIHTQILTMKTETQKSNPQLAIWLLRIGLIALYVVLFIFKKKLYL